MSGAMYHLDNLCCVIDRNRLQISGSTEDVMALDDLKRKIEAFNWHVISVPDGNDIDQLRDAFQEAKATKGQPSCVIANTTKGKGSSVMENKASWHHKLPGADELSQIYADLAAGKAALQP